MNVLSYDMKASMSACVAFLTFALPSSPYATSVNATKSVIVIARISSCEKPSLTSATTFL